MQTLIIEIESNSKAKELSSLISSMDFVRKVFTVHKSKSLLVALQQHEYLKASIVK